MLSASKAVGVTPCLIFGTLLGIVRDGNLWAADGDIDVGFPASDLPRLWLLVEAMAEKGYPLRQAFELEGRLVNFSMNHHRRDTFLDCSVLFEDSDSLRIYEIWDKQDLLCTYSFSKSYFDHLIPWPLSGGPSVPIPANYEQVLVETYGDDWHVRKRNFGLADYPNITMESAGKRYRKITRVNRHQGVAIGTVGDP